MEGSKKGRCGYFSGWGLFWQSADWVTAGEAAPRERSVAILLQGYSGRCRGFLGQASPVGAGEQLPAGYSQLLLGRESLGEVTFALMGSLKPRKSIQLDREPRMARWR